MWPDAASCASCHDGTIEKQVTWSPRAGPRRGNLRFDHVEHAREAKTKAPACTACHTDAGAPRMAVRPPVVARCLDCHEIRTAHLAAPELYARDAALFAKLAVDLEKARTTLAAAEERWLALELQAEELGARRS